LVRRFEKTGLLGMNILAAKRALIVWRKQQIYFNPDAQPGKIENRLRSRGVHRNPFDHHR
jgi:hypothetical protein